MALDDPLDVLARAHQAQLELCDTLERIADDLPAVIPSGMTRWIARSLTHELPLHHRDEERGLFPLLERRCAPSDLPPGAIAQLCMEHAADEDLAGEIAEALSLLAGTDDQANPNALGYMLRCFFECLRRHLVWEDTIILPMAQRALTPNDMRELQQVMLDERASAGLCGAIRIYSGRP